MIVLFTTYLGILVNDYKKRQLKYIDTLIYLGNKIKLLLTSTSPETDEIYKILMTDKQLEIIDFSLPDKNFILSNYELEKTKELLDTLGKYDVDYQVSYIDEYTGHFKMLKEGMQQQYSSHKKLYIPVGLLFGLLIALIII